MPLYDYQCEAGHRYEKREPFGSPPQQPCDQCGKPARRLLNAPPIVFKGSGWYKTDSTRSLRAGVSELGADDSSDGASDGASSSTAAASESGGTAKAKSKAPGKGKGKAKGADAAAAPAPSPAPSASADD